MTTPKIYTYDELVSLSSQTIQAAVPQIFNFNPGSAILAIVESAADMGLAFEGDYQFMMSCIRFLTSNEVFAESFGAQFGYFRLPASNALADCTFSRQITGTAVNIPVGNVVSTQSGVQFAVIADLDNSNYVPGSNSYLVAVGISNITIPVQSLTAGTAGNVGAGTITTINTPIPTITGVTNASQASGGLPQESLDAYKARFVNFLSYQAKGTQFAIIYAVTSVAPGVLCKILERQLPDGTSLNGVVSIIVDDGTGSTTTLPTAFVDACQTAANSVRSCGILYYVVGRLLTDIAVDATVSVQSSVNLTDAQNQISEAITSYLASLTMGSTVYYTRIISVIYNAMAGIVDVSSVTINGSTADVTMTDAYAPRAITAPSIEVNYA